MTEESLAAPASPKRLHHEQNAGRDQCPRPQVPNSREDLEDRSSLRDRSDSRESDEHGAGEKRRRPALASRRPVDRGDEEETRAQPEEDRCPPGKKGLEPRLEEKRRPQPEEDRARQERASKSPGRGQCDEDRPDKDENGARPREAEVSREDEKESYAEEDDAERQAPAVGHARPLFVDKGSLPSQR